MCWQLTITRQISYSLRKETQLYVTLPYCGFCMLFIWVWEQIYFPKCVLTGKQDVREFQKLRILLTIQNWIACWRLRITSIDSIQHRKNISWEYLSLFVCLTDLCSANFNALLTVLSNSSYDSTNKWETFFFYVTVSSGPRSPHSRSF